MSAPGRSDQDRFIELYTQTRHDLLTFVRRRAQSPEDAADMLAETYLIAWRRLDQIPGGDRARLWLFGVARNLLLKTARQARVRSALSDRLGAELRAASTDPAETVDDSSLTALGAALAELSEADRDILTLSAWEDLSPREIAAVIGSQANAVRVRLHRARKRLSRQLDQSQSSPRSVPAPHPSPD